MKRKTPTLAIRLCTSAEHRGYRHLNMEIFYLVERDAADEVAHSVRRGGEYLDEHTTHAAKLFNEQGHTRYYYGSSEDAIELRWQTDDGSDFVCSTPRPPYQSWYGMHVEKLRDMGLETVQFFAKIAKVLEYPTAYHGCGQSPTAVITTLREKLGAVVVKYHCWSAWVADTSDLSMSLNPNPNQPLAESVTA